MEDTTWPLEIQNKRHSRSVKITCFFTRKKISCSPGISFVFNLVRKSSSSLLTES